MDEILSAEILSQQWHFIVPLMLLSMALGWWLRSTVVKREIVSLEKTKTRWSGVSSVLRRTKPLSCLCVQVFKLILLTRKLRLESSRIVCRMSQS
jgi:hypothetical protein